MIKNLDSFSGIDLTLAKQITYLFLFFAVHAEGRIARSPISVAQFSDTLKLGIAVYMPASRLLFQGLALYKIILL